MGFLKHLLFWPVTGPSFLTRFSLEKVEGAVKTELTDDTAVKRELMELQMQLELGDIDDEQYTEREAMLMARLRDVRRWRERFDMPTSGGLVRVADDAIDDEPAAEAADREADADEVDGDDADRNDADAADREPRVARSDEADVDIVLGFDDED